MVDYREGCQAPDWDQHESDRQQTPPREYTNVSIPLRHT